MRYNLTNEFIKINESSAVFYNFGQTPIEISSSQVDNSGFILLSGQKQQIKSDSNIYARSLESAGKLNVVSLL